jgi:hypothetical protein
MLASLQSMGREDEDETGGGRDGGMTPPPPFENFIPGQRETATSGNNSQRVDTPPPPPLEPVSPTEFVGGGLFDPADDDDLPALESVSNSSESADEQSTDEESQEGEEEMPEGPDQTVRAFDLAFRRTRSLETSPERASSWPLFRFWGGARRPADTLDAEAEQVGDTHATATSSRRFSTVVGREERMVIDIDDEDDDESDGEEEAEDDQSISDAKAPTPPPTVPQEPPFMTDGRGRVIWSNSGANKTDSVGPTLHINPAPAPPTALSARPRADHNEIRLQADVPAPDPPAPRSLLGRVLGAFF